ncbi:Uu.00g059850.m01.CDS01 [Anthostomella pinea]|uniref:Peptide hydrolase n=1 Tax=Anthostomella pinea TaxID=933095 RepID=A0AAI8YMI6_9PEZI|nr:Uu.00g059850.m01.CDS01 [Anthostomella pinea]
MKYGQLLWLVQAIALSSAFDVEDAAKQYSESDVRGHLEKFQSIAEKGGQPNNNRFMGSKPHEQTLDYIESQLESWGYKAKRESIDTFYCKSNTVSVHIDNKEIKDVSPFWYSPTGTVEGELAIVEGNGVKESDFGSLVKDKIAIFQRGGDSNSVFGSRIDHAQKAGAKGVLIWNNRPGPLRLPGGTLITLSNPDALGHKYVPTAGLTQDADKDLVERIKTGKVRAKIVSKCDDKEVKTENIIAETKKGDGKNALLIGAHTDSVREGPGINDNGSGVAAVLALAKFFKDFKDQKNKVRFAFWTGEEEGLIGAYKYVRALGTTDLEEIKLYFNVDTLGSPNGINTVVTTSGEETNSAGKYQREFYKSQNLANDEQDTSPAIDAWAFQQFGVRVVAIETGFNGEKSEEEAAKFGGTAKEPYDANYHKAGDTIKNVNMDQLAVSVKAVIYTAAKWSESFDGL